MKFDEVIKTTILVQRVLFKIELQKDAFDP